jgi:transposase
MQAVTTIGLDIAKSVFQVHGIHANGNVLIRHRMNRRAMFWRTSRTAVVSGPDRGLRHVTFLVTPTPYAARLREALCQAAKERCRRRRGHL